MIRQVIQRISNHEASIESLQERRFWLQWERAYTWQPIYQTCGRLMAVELLTVVTQDVYKRQGGVRADGVGLSLSYDKGEANGVWASLSGDQLTGKNVKMRDIKQRP